MSLLRKIRSDKISVMSYRQKSIYFLLLLFYFFSLGYYLLWWFSSSHIPHNFDNLLLHSLDVLLFVLLSFVVFMGTVVRFGTLFAIWHMAKPVHKPPQKGLRVAFLTCYVPEKEPFDLLIKTLKAMKAVNYPHDTWILDEGNSVDVKHLCKQLGVKHFTRAGIEKYNQEKGLYRAKTKAGNHNAWRDKHERAYDIVAQIDMDHVPKSSYFERTLGYFRDESVGLVGMPQIYKNVDNWIARGASEQSHFFHGPIQQGFYGCDMPLLIGTSHIYRTKVMKSVGGYAPTIVEDHLTGMHFYSKKWKGVFVPEILAQGEGPTSWIGYFNQQTRWSYGLFEILFKHTPKLFLKLTWKQKINYFFIQLYYFTGVAVFFGIILTALYLLFGIRSASMNIMEWITHAVPPFILAYTTHIYLHKFQLDPKKEPIFGLFGMFLNLAANTVYTVSFLKFIAGKKLTYMITPKGLTVYEQKTPLKTFTAHIGIVFLMVLSLLYSYVSNHGAIQLRLWALFNLITFSTVVLSSKLNSIITSGNIDKLFYARVRFATIFAATTLILLLFVIAYIQRQSVVNASIIPNVKESNLKETVYKIAPPQKGAFLGVSLHENNDSESLEVLEEKVQKHFAIVGYYQAWDAKDNAFNVSWAKYIYQNDAIPFVTWEPWKPVSGFDRSEVMVNQPNYRLKHITEGIYDTYITQYAKDVAAFEKPVMIRFAHEMNGNWYPWGSTFNTPSEYILAWRHVHEVFDSVGAKNVTWVWSPNEIYYHEKVPYASKIASFYPGDDYVDWVGFSAFNWATYYKQNRWITPEELYDQTITELAKRGKPIIISETASAESTNKKNLKAIWIQSLANYITHRPSVKAIVWFHAKDNGIDWTITSSSESKLSFRKAFSKYFVEYAGEASNKKEVPAGNIDVISKLWPQISL